MARDRLDEVDALLSRPISPLCARGPLDRLVSTEHAQVAVTACNLAALAVLTEEGYEPAVVAGHSVGELTALHAAGVLDLAGTVRLVETRARLMAGAGRIAGGMRAVMGLSAERVEELASAAAAPGSPSWWDWRTRPVMWSSPVRSRLWTGWRSSPPTPPRSCRSRWGGAPTTPRSWPARCPAGRRRWTRPRCGSPASPSCRTSPASPPRTSARSAGRWWRSSPAGSCGPVRSARSTRSRPGWRSATARSWPGCPAGQGRAA
ncbi:ACP S-malonyltransferase [Nonomuraea ferruginea]